MKKYFVVPLMGMVQLGFLLPAQAQDSVQTYVTDQGMIRPLPSDSKRTTDQGSGLFADDNKSDSLLNGHFMAGVGLYIMKPFFQNNPAFFTQTTSSTSAIGTFSSTINTNQHDFDWGLNAAPVIWLGYTSDCGLGVRARWWLFDQKSATSAVSDPNTTIFSAFPAGLSIAAFQSPMFLNSNLKLDVWDFEGTGETQVGHWVLQYSGGFRYAHLSQDYNALSVRESPRPGLPFPLVFLSTLSSGHNFNGAGPTLALEARRPIGNSGLSLFAILRGTMLFGQSKQEGNELNVTQLVTTSTTNETNQSNHDTVLPVAELEIGAEYSLRWGNVYPFVRTGLVAQTWFDAGSASTLDGNLGFLGLSVTAGLNY
jgi:hypothetical protein